MKSLDSRLTQLENDSELSRGREPCECDVWFVVVWPTLVPFMGRACHATKEECAEARVFRVDRMLRQGAHVFYEGWTKAELAKERKEMLERRKDANKYLAHREKCRLADENKTR